MKILNRVCPICQSDKFKITNYSQKDWLVVSCLDCVFVYLKNVPSYNFFVKNFEWHLSANKERIKRREKRKYYYIISDFSKKIKKFFRKGRRKEIIIIEKLSLQGNLLDVGCGDGTTLKYVPKRFNPFGIEISSTLGKDAQKICQKRGGDVLINNSIEGLKEFPKCYFTVILLRSYLEHEINPIKVLEEIWRVLDSNGLVIIKVPNYSSWWRFLRGSSWPGFRFPDHVNYFTPKSLKNIMTQTSFEASNFSLVHFSPTSDNMWGFFKKKY